jgi:hypothetical protein
MKKQYVVAAASIAVLLVVFQNCSSSQSASSEAESVQVSSALGCADSAAVGGWHSNWSGSPDKLTISSDCKGSSSYCSSSFTVNWLDVNAGTALVQISATNGNMGCAPQGQLSCSHTVSSNKSTLDIQCGSAPPIRFFKDPVLAPPPASATHLGVGANGTTYYRVNADLYMGGKRIYTAQHSYSMHSSKKLISAFVGANGQLLTLLGTKLYEGYHSYSCTLPATCTATCTFQTGASTTSPMNYDICN